MTIYINTQMRPITPDEIYCAQELNRTCVRCHNREDWRREIVMAGGNIIVGYCWECSEMYIIHLEPTQLWHAMTVWQECIHTLTLDEALAIPGMPQGFSQIPF